MPPPEANQNKAENLQEQPKPKLDRIDAKLDGADTNGGAKDIGETGVTDAENVSKQEKGTLVKLTGFTREQFAALQKRGITLPKIPGLPDAAQPNVEDLKTGAQAVTSTELIQGAVDGTRTATEGIKKTVHTMRGGTIEDLKNAQKTAAGAVVDTVRAGVDPAVTKAAGAIGEKKGRDAAPNLPIFGDAAKEQAGKVGRVVGEQGAKSGLDALAGKAKDATNNIIDTIAGKGTDRAPAKRGPDAIRPNDTEKAAEGAERTPQQELRELIGKYHHSKNEKVQKDCDAIFANLEPQRAQAMINVYKTMDSQQQQRFMEKMHTDADVFAKMTPQGREQCAHLLGATPEEREQMIHTLPKGDLAKVRNLYMNDREGWNAMTEFYNRTDALASGEKEMQQVLERPTESIATVNKQLQKTFDTFATKDPTLKPQFDAVFRSIPPARAQEMLRVFGEMNDGDKRSFLETLGRNAQVFSKLSEAGRSISFRMPAVSADERQQLLNALPAGDKRMLQEHAKGNPEDWQRVGDFYAKLDAPKAEEQIAKVDEGAVPEGSIAVGRMENREKSRPGDTKENAKAQKGETPRDEEKTINSDLIAESREFLKKYGERVQTVMQKIPSETLQKILRSNKESPALSVALNHILQKGSEEIGNLSEGACTFLVKFLFQTPEQSRSEFVELGAEDREKVQKLVKSVGEGQIGQLPKEIIANILNDKTDKKTS